MAKLHWDLESLTSEVEELEDFLNSNAGAGHKEKIAKAIRNLEDLISTAMDAKTEAEVEDDYEDDEDEDNEE